MSVTKNGVQYQSVAEAKAAIENSGKETLTVVEACILTGKTPQYIGKLTKAGTIVGKKDGYGRWQLNTASVQEWVAKKQQKAAERLYKLQNPEAAIPSVQACDTIAKAVREDHKLDKTAREAMLAAIDRYRTMFTKRYQARRGKTA